MGVMAVINQEPDMEEVIGSEISVHVVEDPLMGGKSRDTIMECGGVDAHSRYVLTEQQKDGTIREFRAHGMAIDFGYNYGLRLRSYCHRICTAEQQGGVQN